VNYEFDSIELFYDRDTDGLVNVEFARFNNAETPEGWIARDYDGNGLIAIGDPKIVCSRFWPMQKELAVKFEMPYRHEAPACRDGYFSIEQMAKFSQGFYAPPVAAGSDQKEQSNLERALDTACEVIAVAVILPQLPETLRESMRSPLTDQLKKLFIDPNFQAKQDKEKVEAMLKDGIEWSPTK